MEIIDAAPEAESMGADRTHLHSLHFEALVKTPAAISTGFSTGPGQARSGSLKSIPAQVTRGAANSLAMEFADLVTPQAAR